MPVIGRYQSFRVAQLVKPVQGARNPLSSAHAVFPSEAQKLKSSAFSIRNKRQGKAVVEFAIIGPLLLFFILGIIEFGRMMMVQQILTNCAREGARRAVVSSATSTDVYDVIDTYMTNNMLSGQTRTVSPDPATASAGTTITVTVTIPYSNVTWLPANTLNGLTSALPWLFGSGTTMPTTMRASVSMRKESN